MRHLFTRRVAVALMLTALLALAASALTAQETNRQVTDNARAVTTAYPEGDIYTTTPGFTFTYSPAPAATVTYFRVQVLDGATELFKKWYLVDDYCVVDGGDLDCAAFPEVVLHSGVGDKALSWNLVEYDEGTGISAPQDYNFTIKAPEPIAPTTFSDLNGSPAFTMAGDYQAISYQLYIRDAVTKDVILNEWVNVESGDCPDACEIYLYPPYAPIYEEGSYELFTRAYTYFEDYTPWSQAFTFTVDYPANGPDAPSVEPFDVFTRSVAESTIFGNILEGESCSFGESMTCDTNTPSILFFVADHQSQVQQIVREDLLAQVQNTENQRGFDDRFAIFNATQYFNVTVTDSNQNPVFNQWINTYTNDLCISIVGLNGGSILREQMREPIDGSGVCVVDLPALAEGNYTVTYKSYNPGGQPSDSFDLTIDLTPPPLDLETVETTAISQVEVDMGEQFVELIWESETFIPKWIRFIVTDSNGEVFNQWVKAELVTQVEIGLLEAIISGEIDFTDPIEETQVIYDAYTQQTLCFAGSCLYVLPLNMTDGEYQLTIQTYVDSVSGVSDPIPFSVQNDPTVISEVEGELDVMRAFDVEGNSRPTYSWVSSENAQWQRLEVEDSLGNPVFAQWYRSLALCSTFNIDITLEEGEYFCELQPPVDMAAGESYTWRVRAWNSDGLGAYSSDQTLNISDAALTAPVPVSPVAAGNPHSGSPTFIFEAATNASWYQLRVTDSDDNEIVFEQWFYYPESDCTSGVGGNECVIDVDDDMPFELLSGDFTWQVRAANGGNTGTFTTPTPFTVDNGNTGVPLITPVEEITDGAIDFYWLPSPYNNFYKLNIWRMDPNFEFADNPTREELASGDFSEVVFSQWFNEDALGESCGIDLFANLRTTTQQRGVEVELPPYYCTYGFANNELEPGIYVWSVDSYTATYGNEILISEQVEAFIKQ